MSKTVCYIAYPPNTYIEIPEPLVSRLVGMDVIYWCRGDHHDGKRDEHDRWVEIYHIYPHVTLEDLTWLLDYFRRTPSQQEIEAAKAYRTCPTGTVRIHGIEY